MTSSFELLVGSVGAAALWILWFYFCKEQRSDTIREELFTLRRDLFLLAASGEVSFDSRAYIELRYRINGMLRFAHRISLATFLISRRLSEKELEDSNGYERWRQSLADVSPGARARLEAIHEQMLIVYVEHLIHGSVILEIFYRTFLIKRFVSHRFAAFRREPSEFVHVARMEFARHLEVETLERQAYREYATV